ncbi:glutamyl-tRNA reductase [Demequina lignilytica]|uniref:Glutamyl-tRNA reductase n=1 Tax=Demequina lignilytica TaxID=3051663 RepID=A0AAW7M3G2_9MICO|nr:MULTISPECIES: glutamyl-tRNA reductase [unclassified Demequina]MDN4477627.1 glutamyl-tRNA reductase [Demequina sp. SYSU T00039-1]MDN4483671.1 glutamyl-tRNA reductase [Demequina sp. SYSU T0a273]MDN4488022.1 glutamyl-tRNA reductase [Demequina sp. SYSU T00039]MDN4490462.1 glutamyl-tRNA reductase [Demequina sp. SYSU T00068]
MPLLSLVASHRNRDLAILEQLQVGADRLAAELVDRHGAVTGAVVLPTCNRFEVYVEAEDLETARHQVVEAIAELSQLDPRSVEDSLMPFEGDDAVQHLLSVTSGLESMVVGEREISGQVRRAHLDSQRRHHITPRLDRLFQSALRTSRVVASSTGLGTSGRSVVSVAFDLASDTVEWEDARVLLIGTGALAETAVGVLNGRGARIFGVYSPSGRSLEFSVRHGMDAITAAGLEMAIREADVVVTCSGGESVVVTSPLVAAARHGIDHPLTIVDLALHRDVAPGVAGLRGVTVIGLDQVGEHAPGESVGAIEAARSIVAHAVARFGDGETARSLDPAVVALREHVFGLLEREIARIRPASGASPEAIARADETEQALRRFAKTLLHTPTVRAREHAQAGESSIYLDAIRALYGIDVAVPDDACPAPAIDADGASSTTSTDAI